MASQFISPMQTSKPQKNAGLSSFEDLGAEEIPQDQINKFDDIINFTLGDSIEGGYTVDHAGPTNRGVTQTTFDRYRKDMGLPVRDVKTIRDDEVYDLYASDYYEKHNIDKLPHNVAGVVFDYGVNSGPKRAIKDLQSVLGVVADGNIGPKTQAAVNDFVEKNGEKVLAEKVINKREKFMKNLIQENPDKYKKFENGWNNRIKMLREKYTQVTDAMNPFHVGEANADEGGLESFSDLGAEPIDAISSDFSDLGAEPINEQPTPDQIKATKTPIFERIGKGFGTGVAGMVEGIGGVAKWFGHEKLGESINKYADEMMQYYEIPDPDFTSQVAAGAGSMATFMIPGLGVARGVNALAAMPRLATWLGVSASSVMEASVEAGGAYNKMIAKGMDHKEASTAATKDFWLNLPVLVYTNKFGIFGEGGGRILKGLKSASGEAVQEFSQQLIGNFSTKDPLMEGALESAAVGAIVGGGTGMLMSAAERKEVEKIKAKDEVEQVVPEPVNATITEEPATEPVSLESVSTDVAKPAQNVSVNVTPEMKAAVESGQPTIEVTVPTEVIVEPKQEAKSTSEQTSQAVTTEQGNLSPRQKNGKELVESIQESGRYVDSEGSVYDLDVGTNKDGVKVIYKWVVDENGNRTWEMSGSWKSNESSPKYQQFGDLTKQQERPTTEPANANQDTAGVEADTGAAGEAKAVTEPVPTPAPTRPEDFKTAEEYVASKGIKAFHGTPDNIKKFEFGKKVENRGGSSFGYGINITEDIGHAKAYTGKDGNVYSVVIPESELSNLITWETSVPREISSSVPKIDMNRPIPFGGGATVEKVGNSWKLKSGETAFSLSQKEFDRMFGDNNTGEQIYRRLVASLGNEKAASEWLLSKGIKGIANSTERNVKNYTIFDPSIIKTESQLTAEWKAAQKAQKEQKQEAVSDVDTIASDFAGRLSQNVGDFHKRFAQAIIDKNPEFISQLVAQAETANRNARAIFVKYTGVELPKTIGGKREAIYKWAGKELPKPKEKAPEPPKMSREEAFKKAQAQRAENALKKSVRFNGEIVTKKQMIETLAKDGYVAIERDVEDTAAREKDFLIVKRAREKYILGVSNPNIPLVKDGNEALQRLAKNEYKKKDYVARNPAGNSFYDISKTEYDYLKSLQQKPAEPVKKEPWQMTAKELAEYTLNKYNGDLQENVFGDTRPKMRRGDKDYNIILKEHRIIVERAISEGKPVPTEVLAEYPDLKEEPVKAADEVKRKEKYKIVGGQKLAPESFNQLQENIYKDLGIQSNQLPYSHGVKPRGRVPAIWTSEEASKIKDYIESETGYSSIIGKNEKGNIIGVTIDYSQPNVKNLQKPLQKQETVAEKKDEGTVHPPAPAKDEQPPESEWEQTKRLIAEKQKQWEKEKSSAPVKSSVPPPDKHKSVRLRTIADNMESLINSKINSATSKQNPTAKRARVAAQQYEEGMLYKKVQSILRSMANESDAGTLPVELSGINNRSIIEDILRRSKYPDLSIHKMTFDDVLKAIQGKPGSVKLRQDLGYTDSSEYRTKLTPKQLPVFKQIVALAHKSSDSYTVKRALDEVRDYERVKSAGINNQAEYDAVKQMLNDRAEGLSEEQKRARKIKELETKFIGVKMPGFFPTPRPTAEKIIDMADIQPGMKVLEPSAGMGGLADIAKERGADVETYEKMYSLQELLKEKGHNVVGGDFMEAKPEPVYDRIVMNPPFENMQDVDHVMRAFEFLKPGGKLVAITSESPFFRSEQKAQDFRTFVDENGYSEKLPEGSFKSSFVSTGVNTRVVVLEKAEIAQPKPAEAVKKEHAGDLGNGWKMTKDEFIRYVISQNALEMVNKDYWGNQHKLMVKEAISEGKPVPAEVLAEYPDLKEEPVKEAEKIKQEKTAEQERPSDEDLFPKIKSKEKKLVQKKEYRIINPVGDYEGVFHYTRELAERDMEEGDTIIEYIPSPSEKTLEDFIYENRDSGYSEQELRDIHEKAVIDDVMSGKMLDYGDEDYDPILQDYDEIYSDIMEAYTAVERKKLRPIFIKSGADLRLVHRVNSLMANLGKQLNIVGDVSSTGRSILVSGASVKELKSIKGMMAGSLIAYKDGENVRLALPGIGTGSFAASVGTFAEEILQGSTVEPGKKEAEIKPVAVIEMVKLAKMLMGEFPTLKRFPKAWGMFYGQGKGSIKLTPDLFKAGKEKQLAATLAHEIGHLVDYLPDQTLKRGNVLGRLATLVDYTKTLLPRLSDDNTRLGQNKGDVEKEIKERVKRTLGGKPDKNVKEWYKEVSKMYAEELKKDLKGSVQEKELRKEMVDLSFEWRPVDGGENDVGFMAYRNSSKELYADALSALLNNPGYVKTKAPLFYEMFFEYLDKKPEFKKAYLYMEQIMQGRPADLMEIRLEDRRMMFAKGDAIRDQLDKEAENRIRDTWQNLRQLLDDRFYPIAKRLNRQKRDAIVPSSEAVHLLREAGMWQVDAYKYTQQIDTDAIKPMIVTGATTQDLGDYQYLRRVIGKAEIDKNAEIAKAINTANEEVINALRAQGYEIADNLKDREQLANPLGYTPESAREALDYLKSKLTPEQWSAIVEADKKYRDITFKIVQQAANEGVYNKDVFENVILPNKDTYASFGVLDYITDNVAAGIKSSKGTLKEIENPFITTTLKTVSLIRLIARNKATKATIEELGSLYPGDVTESKRMFNAAGPTGYMKAQQGKGQVKYLVDGKIVSFDVDPYISRSMENDDTQMLEVAASFSKWSGNQIFRNLVITFNPAFQMFNVARDFGRSYVNLNAILSAQGKSVSIADVLKAYYKAIPLSVKRNMGITDAKLDEMMAHKALGIPFNDYNIDARDDGYARVLRKYKVIGDNMEAKTVREKLVKGWTQVDSAVRFAGNIIETLPKVAGYNLLKEKGVSDRELGYLTRTYLGTPDFQVSGKWTKLTNQIFTFSNVTIQGAKSDVRLAINPTTRAGWHLANFKISVLPMLAMAAAILGFMGKDLEDWFEKVPEFDKTNYIIIPLGVDDNGRARYARLPHNQTSRISTAILYKMLTAQKNKVDGLGGAIDITASQLPSLAPILTTMGAWGSFLQGQNPQDMFRGRQIISDQAFTAGGIPAIEKMVQFTFNNFGFSQFTTYDDRRNTTFEAGMQATPFVSALTRIVKTTDYGLVEKSRAISREAAKETAERNIKQIKLFEQQLNGYTSYDIGNMIDREGDIKQSSELKTRLREITDELYGSEVEKGDYKTTEKAFIRFALKEYNDPWVNGFLSAPSNEVKVKVLKQAKDSLQESRYNEIVAKLKRAGLVSRDLQKEFNENAM